MKYAGNCIFCVQTGMHPSRTGGSWPILAGPRRSWPVLADPGRSWPVLAGPGRSWTWPEISGNSQDNEAHIAIMMQTVGTAENELIYATPPAAEQDVQFCANLAQKYTFHIGSEFMV